MAYLSVGLLPLHRDQLWAQRSVTSMGKLHLFTRALLLFQYSLPMEYFTLHFDVVGVANTTIMLTAELGVSLGYVYQFREMIALRKRNNEYQQFSVRRLRSRSSQAYVTKNFNITIGLITRYRAATRYVTADGSLTWAYGWCSHLANASEAQFRPLHCLIFCPTSEIPFNPGHLLRTHVVK